MPNIVLSHINVNKESSKVTLQPIISGVVDGDSGPVLEPVVVSNEIELDVYFPNLRNRESYVDLLRSGNLLNLVKVPFEEDLSELNYTSLVVGKPGQIPYMSLNVNSTKTKLFEAWSADSPFRVGVPARYCRFIDNYESLSNKLMSGERTFGYKLTIPTTKPLSYFVLRGTLGSYNNVEVLFIYDSAGRSTNDILRSLGFRLDNNIQVIRLGNTSIAHVTSQIRSVTDSNRCRVATIGNEIRIQYDPDLPSTVAFSDGFKLVNDDTYNNLRLLSSLYSYNGNFSGFCEITSKWPGKYYNHIWIEFRSPARGTLEVSIGLDDYSETFVGGILSTKSDYICEVINTNSKLINIIIPLLGGAVEESSDSQIALIYNDLERILSGIAGRRYYLYNKCPNTSKADGSYHRAAVESINEYDYSTYLLVDGFDRDSAISPTQYSEYIKALISKAEQFNCFTAINYVPNSNTRPIPSLTSTSAKERLILIGGDARRFSDYAKVMSIVPWVNEISNQDMLGNIRYNFDNSESTDRSLPNTVKINRYSRDIGSLNYVDNVTTVSGIKVTPIIWSIRITKTINNYLKELIPNVTKSSVVDVFETIKRDFKYIDRLELESYNYDRLGTLTLKIELVSITLNISTKKLIININ